MAETIPSASTFDAITASYTSKVLVDQIFVGTPTLLEAKRHLTPMRGRDWEPLLEYGKATSAVHTKRGTTFSLSAASQIATRGKFTPAEVAWPLVLYEQDIKEQAGLALLDFVKVHIDNVVKVARDDLNAELYTGDGSADPPEITGLSTILDDTATWGGLDPSTYTWWKPHVMDGEDSYATAVSPSLENMELCIDTTQMTTSGTLDIAFCKPELWRVLKAQISTNDYLMAKVAYANHRVVKWGFPTFWIRDVPFVQDRDCPGAAWVEGQSSRANAKGYEVFMIDWDYLQLGYVPSVNMEWRGWQKPIDSFNMVNYLRFWGNFVGTSRRAHCRVFNIDITQDPSVFQPGQVDIPS